MKQENILNERGVLRMEIKVYVTWDNMIIHSQKQHLKEHESNINDLFEDDSFFEEYLFQNYSNIELYKMDKEEREEIREDFLDYCRATVEADDVFEEIILEI